MTRVAYADVHPPNAEATAARTFTHGFRPSAAAPFAIDVEGACPRCDDPTSYTHPLLIARDYAGPGGVSPERAEGMWDLAREHGEGTPESWTFTVICRCKETHKGAPTGVSGCGAYWNMTIGRPAGPR
jgi:hypothetical protein